MFSHSENFEPTALKISIVTATWNCAETVLDCILSVSTQTYPNREHIVIDGGSQDDTKKILHEHRNKFSTYVSEPDTGIYDALNKGIDKSTGDVIGFLHADDVYADPLTLEKIADAFKDPEISAVYGDLEYVKKNDLGKVIRHWKSSTFKPSSLQRGWMPPHPTLYVRRGRLKEIGGFDTSYRIAADYFSVLQLFSIEGLKSIYIPEVLVKMRLGGISNRSFKNIFVKSYEDLSALRRSGVGGVRSLVWKNLTKLKQF